MLLAAHDRVDREHRPLDARWLARPRGALVYPLEGALDCYERPPLGEAIEQELVEFVERRAAELGDPIKVAA